MAAAAATAAAAGGGLGRGEGQGEARRPYFAPGVDAFAGGGGGGGGGFLVWGKEAVHAQLLPERAQQEGQQALRPCEGAVGGAAEAVVAACRTRVGRSGVRGQVKKGLCLRSNSGRTEKGGMALSFLSYRLPTAPSKNAPKRRSIVSNRPVRKGGGRTGPAAPTWRMMSNPLYYL